MQKSNLTQGPIGPTILKMAGGMLFGFAAMTLFNAVDTYFVGQLGTKDLAAMSFTFPVVMIINSISIGLGVGISSVVARTIGAGEHHKVQRLTTDGLALSLMIVAAISAIGWLTIDPLFQLLGARGETLELVRDYMAIWYLGTPFVVIPMAGNSVIRATGDTLTPSLIMSISVVVNIFLDYFLIFGIGPFPEMGIAGAALATVIARFCTLIASFSILLFREKLISLKRPDWMNVKASWKQIAYVGIPAALVQIINPLSLGIVTRLLAQFGENVVAGFGAASRVEMLILIFPMSLAIVMAPFSGQNWGAQTIGRILKGLHFSSLLSVAWGAIIFVLLLFLAEPIMTLFNNDTALVQTGALYLQIACLSYGFLGILTIATQSFNAMNMPMKSAGIILVRTFGLTLPLAFLGASFWNENGVYGAIFIANLLGGFLGLYMLRKTLNENRGTTEG